MGPIHWVSEILGMVVVVDTIVAVDQIEVWVEGGEFLMFPFVLV